MYINALGTLRGINARTQRNNTNRLSANTNNLSHTDRLSNASRLSRMGGLSNINKAADADSFSTAMKKAVESGNYSTKAVSPLWNGGTLITKDALARMKTDSEYAQKVMDKIQNYASTENTDKSGLQIIEANGKDSYLSNSLLGQSGLQSYLSSSLVGRSGLQSYLSSSLSGQSGLQNYLATAAYGNSKNSLLNTSLLGSMFL